MGLGDDTVVGTGAEIAIGGTSSGIFDSRIELGAGNDRIEARGASEGVRDVFLFGEAGDDVFDLHSGTGTVDGGAGTDLLILSGDKGDFIFTEQAPNGVLIDDTIGSVTLLDVDNVEFFKFDDGVYAYDQLFS